MVDGLGRVFYIKLFFVLTWAKLNIFFSIDLHIFPNMNLTYADQFGTAQQSNYVILLIYRGMGSDSARLLWAEPSRAEPTEPVPIVGFKRSSEPNRLEPTQTDSDIISPLVTFTTSKI